MLKLLREKSTKNIRQGTWLNLYECSCGNTLEAVPAKVKSGHTRSCGCLRKTTITKHGYCHHPLYDVWQGMIERCRNPRNVAYKNYGGRGITVCAEWQRDAKAFCEWALNNGYRKGLFLDRKDNNGNYEPNNCRLVTREINNQNTRINKLTEEKVLSILLRIKGGEKQTVLAQEFNVDNSVISEIKTGKTWRNVGRDIERRTAKRQWRRSTAGRNRLRTILTNNRIT